MTKTSFKFHGPSDVMYDIWNRIDDFPASWNLLHRTFSPMSFLESVEGMLVNESGIESSSLL
jgi:hypothetical protein